VRSEVHDGVDTMLGHQPRYQRVVPDIAHDELARRERLSETLAQIVENQDALAGFTQLANHMAANVAGAAGDENGSLGQINSTRRRGN
jgi:hypothetical protein